MPLARYHGMMTKRILTTAVIFFLVLYIKLTIPTPSDMTWPLCAAREWVEGRSPYGAVCFAYRAEDGAIEATYPLTTVLAFVPLIWASPAVATALVLALSSALMAWGLLRRSTAHLALFFSFPYLHSLYYGQWAPMLLGVALSPALLPLTLLKPHVGTPIVMRYMTRRRVLGCAVFGLVSLLLFPSWPLEWLHLTSNYRGYIPLLTVPGIVAGALLFWNRKKKHALYLALCLVTPQRGAYDPLIVGPALETVLAWVALGWLITWLGWRYTPLPVDWTVVAATYIPAAYLLCYNNVDGNQKEDKPPQEGH